MKKNLHNQSRRNFLKTSSATMLTLPLMPNLKLLADPEPDRSVDPHFFIFIQMRGAWDVCMAFDPKNRDELLPDSQRAYDQPYSMQEVKDYHGILIPPTGDVLGKYASHLMFINGIDMELDRGHSSDTIMTGNLFARTQSIPYVQMHIAKHHPYVSKCLLPHIYTVYDNDFYSAHLSEFSFRMILEDLNAILKEGSSVSQSTQKELVHDLLGDYLTQIKDDDFARTLTGHQKNILKLKDFINKVNQEIKFPDDMKTFQERGKFLGAFFKAGILGSATFSLGSLYNFDTHFDHYASHPLTMSLQNIDELISGLKEIKYEDGSTVFDKTTLVLSSEFTRTPLLNGIGGKDHNFRTNSLAFIGKNVPSKVFGQSGARKENDMWVSHAGLPIDFSTGLAKEDGQILKTSNVWAGLKNVFGFDIGKQFPGVKPIEFV